MIELLLNKTCTAQTKTTRCPMPCCSSMRSPVACAAAPRYRRSNTVMQHPAANNNISNNIVNDPYSVGDLSSLYRSSCYTSHRRCRHHHHHLQSSDSYCVAAGESGVGPAVVGGTTLSSRRPQLIAEFVDIIDQCGPRRLYSKRYCYPHSSSSKLSKNHHHHHNRHGYHHNSRGSPRDSDFYLHDLFRNSKFYSRSGSQDDQGKLSRLY